MDGGCVERLDDCVWLFNLDGCVERLEYNIRRLFLLMFTRSRFASQVLRRGRSPLWFIERSSRRWGAVPPEYYIKCWLRII